MEQRPLCRSCAGGPQLVLRSSVLTVLNFNELNATMENAEILGSVLSGEGETNGGGWWRCRSAPVSLSCPLPLLSTRLPSLLVCCFFVVTVMGATSTAFGRLEVNLVLSKKQGGKSHIV
jgi:hypothetical protein